MNKMMFLAILMVCSSSLYSATVYLTFNITDKSNTINQIAYTSNGIYKTLPVSGANNYHILADIGTPITLKHNLQTLKINGNYSKNSITAPDVDATYTISACSPDGVSCYFTMTLLD